MPPFRTSNATFTTGTFTVSELQQAYRYLQRASVRAPDYVAQDLRSSDECVERGLRRTNNSHNYALMSWRKDALSDKQVLTFGEGIDRKMREAFPFLPIIKIYLNGDRPDSEKIIRVGELEEELYYARLKDSSIPAAGISAYTSRFLHAARTGRNLAYEILPSLPSAEHPGIAQRVLDMVDGFTEFAIRHPHLVSAARADRVEEKMTRFIQTISTAAGCDPNDLCAHNDGERLIDDLLSEGLVMPQWDATTTNIVLEDDGTLRQIDLDNAVAQRYTCGFVRSHIAFDPAIALPFDERMSLTDSLPSAAFYTTYRAARVMERDELVPFENWIPIAERRSRGFVENWRALFALPEARERYPVIAELAARIDPSGLRIAAKISSSAKPPIMR